MLIVEAVLFEFTRIPSEATQLERLECPGCENGRMRKRTSERERKVIIDFCEACRGTWLDGGELEAVQRENIFPVVYRAIRLLVAEG